MSINEMLSIVQRAAYQMTGKQDLCSSLGQVLNGGNGSSDASVVGDLKIAVQRHVQICSDENPLALEISLLQCRYALLRHGDRGAREECRQGTSGFGEKNSRGSSTDS